MNDKITKKDKIKFVAEGIRNTGVAVFAGGCVVSVNSTGLSSWEFWFGFVLAGFGIVIGFLSYQILNGGIK